MVRPVSEAATLLKKHLKNKKKDTFFKTDHSTLVNLITLINQFDALKYLPDNDIEKAKRNECISSLKMIMEEQLDCSTEPLKTIKEIIEENVTYYSTDSIYCYWSGPGKISDTPPGIAILINDTRIRMRQKEEPFPLNFKELAIQNLEYLYLMPTGKILLDQLLNFSQNNQHDENIFILPMPMNRGNNIAYQNPEHALHLLAKELMSKQKADIQLINALKRATDALHLDDPYQWLADCINNTPELNLIGMPGEKPFLPSKNIMFQGKDIENWIEGELEVPAEIKYHFFNAIVVALQDYAAPNMGTGSIIRWNPSPENKRNQQRPMAIGLAHELCHAYYNSLGIQPGNQDFDESTVLFEYLTTGLGPWKTVQVCENRLREEWNNILSEIPKEDKLNRKAVEERTFYDLDAPEAGEKHSCTII